MAKKYIVFVLIFFSVLLTACTRRAEPAKIPDIVSDHVLEVVSGKSALSFFRDEGISVGWNLGNTLDSYRSGVGGEVYWSNPPVTQELMDAVRAAGFDIIRIPVTWMGHIGDAPDYLVSTARLERVAEVVDMARNAGFKAVIINLHHDGSTTDVNREDGWLSVSKASRNQEASNQITAQFTRLWEQIAAYFKNYGDWLIFEGFNELHDGNWSAVTDPGQFIVIHRWNQTFVDTVRSTGGNNENRYLVISGYVKAPRHTLSGFTLPRDSAKDKLIVSIHYYDPYEFGIAGTRLTWGTDADRQKVEDDFAPFKERYIDNGVPVIIGESGAVLQFHDFDEEKEGQARQSRVEYIPYVYAAAARYGLVPIYWDNGLNRGDGEKFGLFDRWLLEPNSEDSEELLRLMINAVKL